MWTKLTTLIDSIVYTLGHFADSDRQKRKEEWQFLHYVPFNDYDHSEENGDEN